MHNHGKFVDWCLHEIFVLNVQKLMSKAQIKILIYSNKYCIPHMIIFHSHKNAIVQMVMIIFAIAATIIYLITALTA